MRNSLVIIFVFFLNFSNAQLAHTTFSPIKYSSIENSIERQNYSLHTSCKPYFVFDLTDSTLKYRQINKIDSSEANISFAPIIGLTPYFDANKKEFFYDNTYGVSALVSYKYKFAFEGKFARNDIHAPYYIDSLMNNFQVIPGIDKAKLTKGGFSAWYKEFHLSYKPSKYFVLQAGRGKNFFGDGYRSLLLSDNAAPYPFIKIRTSVWHFQYTNLYTLMNNVFPSIGGTRYKFNSIHYLSWNIHRKLNLSFFESIVFANRDTSNNTLSYDINYLNPLIFYRPVEYSIGSSDNAFMGGNLKWNFVKNHQLYFQMMLDEFYVKEIKARNGWWANKQGYQFGYKWFNAFTLKNLFLQAEYNYIRPYTYTHGLITQSYTHLNQSLAHPIGANLTEKIFIIRYQKTKWLSELKINSIIYGVDSMGVNVGQNINRSYVKPYKTYGNYIGQGLKNNLTIFSFKFIYHVFPKGLLDTELWVLSRNQINTINSSNNLFIGIGIKSNMINKYWDF